jgi:hypothetical protein
MALYELRDTGISPEDLQRAAANQQWFADADVASAASSGITNANQERIYFLNKVFGATVVIIKDGKTIVPSVANPDFQNKPLRLGSSWSITGVTAAYGFYIDIRKP